VCADSSLIPQAMRVSVVAAPEGAATANSLVRASPQLIVYSYQVF